MTQALKVCLGQSCSDYGSKYLLDRAASEQKARDLDLTIETCNCLGRCEQAPNIKLDQQIHGQMTGPKLASLLK